MDGGKITKFIDQCWEDSIVPTLSEYIRIPNKSPAFDPEWEAHGYMRDAVKLLEKWARDHVTAFPGATVEVVQLPKRTPVILIEIPGGARETVLLYGHLDKQPEFTGWGEGLGPWTPVRRGNRLYGRGGADDGYAMFGSLTALLSLKDQNIPHARCVIIIEACEESGSYDLPFYVDHLASRIGKPSLVVCLDSGCGNYDQLWLTTSLRGLTSGDLTVRVLTEGVHSGDASGIVPSSFRILQQLLARIEDSATGKVLLKELYGDIPAERAAQAQATADVLAKDVYSKFPWAGGTKPIIDDLKELILNRTWRPQLATIGIDGLPLPKDAGNVMLPFTMAKLSMRLPPNVSGAVATTAMKTALEASPPYNAQVSFKGEDGMAGWNAPALSSWLEESVAAASKAAFGKPPAYMGEGGSIPFMGMLGAKFPKTQFVITGVLGPHSNAHGPNEFLDIPTGKRVTMCIASVVADHYAQATGARKAA
ncbi:MAG: M20 family metallopeptidase [Proteobacteria bacterium]|nr:M20 family metallopeptidase [Pseudomonadota bacterium]